MLKIDNTEVYGLEQAMRKAGYSMQMGNPDLTDCGNEKDVKRGRKLGKVKVGSGHDSYLKSVIVNFDIYAPHYLLPQMQRYHWFEFVSSQSKMHRLGRADFSQDISEYCDPRIIEIIEEKQLAFRADKNSYQARMELLASTPLGFAMWAACTTNYLQLKTMYHQRKYHKLKEDWGYFCRWCESLPRFSELVLGKLPKEE